MELNDNELLCLVIILCHGCFIDTFIYWSKQWCAFGVEPSDQEQVFRNFFFAILQKSIEMSFLKFTNENKLVLLTDIYWGKTACQWLDHSKEVVSDNASGLK